MSDNIVPLDSGEFKVIGMDGEELKNSPYESETKAKQALNAHKMGYDGDEKDQDENDNGNENSIDIDQDGENNNSGEDDSSYMSVLSNKYVLVGGSLAVAYLILKDRDSEANNVETQQQEEEQTENQETDTSSDNLDAGRMSAKDVLG